MTRIALCLSFFSAGALCPALAADTPFVGPSGWSHVDVPATSDTTRKFDQWHIAGDVATVTFIKDSSTSYADAIATIQKNFASNGLKPIANKDVTCQGKVGHVVEFATGPEGHRIIINRMLVPDGNGVVTITYARSDGSTFDPDVQKSETVYCAASSS